jgi:hypothetical protein
MGDELGENNTSIIADNLGVIVALRVFVLSLNSSKHYKLGAVHVLCLSNQSSQC